MFTTDIDPAVDPVFTGLGGLKWLNHRKATVKTIMRQSKNCCNCSASEAQVKLLKCLQCQHALYWSVLFSSRIRNSETIALSSKECQKMNWPYHKYIYHYMHFMNVLTAYLNNAGYIAGDCIGLIMRYII